MRFYYFSFFSLIPLLAIYAIGTVLLAWVAYRLLRGKKGRWFIVAPLALLVYFGPIAEEFWIAYNFGQLCRKDAGLFINKTVEVEGFYDSTMRSAYENTKPGRYRFVEHATENRQGFERVRRATEEERSRALAWYVENNPGKERPKDRSIFHPLSEKETVAVLSNGIEAWHITKLDKPTARYHYFRDSGIRVTHKIGRQQSTVVDTQMGDSIAKYVRYHREAPWYFIDLDQPNIACDGPDGGPKTKHSFLIYQETLKPIAH